MPFACFGHTGPALPQQWVDIDNRQATTAVVEHVLARGFRRVAYLGYRSANHWDAERAAGSGMAWPAGSFRPTGWTCCWWTTPARGARSGRCSAPASPTRSSPAATGSPRWCTVAAELRLRIGRDLAVTGFDGSVTAGLCRRRDRRGVNLMRQELKELLTVRSWSRGRGFVTQLLSGVLDARPLDHLLRKRQAHEGLQEARKAPASYRAALTRRLIIESGGDHGRPSRKAVISASRVRSAAIWLQ